MSSSTKSLGRRLLAAVGATVVGAAVLVAPASAAPDDYGNIDSSETGSIIIHKHEHQTTTSETASPDGSGSISSDPVSGVVFTAYAIVDANGDQVDLTVAENWDWLEGLTVSESGVLSGGPTATDSLSESPGPWTVSTSGISSSATDADGEATISNLSIGAYVVIETSSPSTVVDQAQPFVVTIPYPYDDGWLYDVNVYPKNGVADTPVKSVNEQEDLGLGSTASFEVKTSVPAIDDAAYFDYYWVSDSMDQTYLSNGDVSTVVLTDSGGSATTLTEGTDYTVTNTSGLVEVKFTGTGLLKLKDAGPGTLVTTFTGKVTAVPADGKISDTAGLLTDTRVPAGTTEDPTPTPENPGTPGTPTGPTDPTDPDYPGTPSNEVTTNWGDVQISKVDESGVGLSDAVFEVYEAADPYAESADKCGTEYTGSAITVDGKTQFTSNGSGVVSIAGLFVNDSTNSASETFRCYVLVEVQAPAGYTTPSGDSALTAVAVEAGTTDVNAGYDATVTNTQQSVPELPLTGADGQLLMMIGGVVLVLLAGGGALVIRSRSKNNIEN